MRYWLTVILGLAALGALTYEGARSLRRARSAPCCLKDDHTPHASSIQVVGTARNAETTVEVWSFDFKKRLAGPSTRSDGRPHTVSTVADARGLWLKVSSPERAPLFASYRYLPSLVFARLGEGAVVRVPVPQQGAGHAIQARLRCREFPHTVPLSRHHDVLTARLLPPGDYDVEIRIGAGPLRTLRKRILLGQREVVIDTEDTQSEPS